MAVYSVTAARHDKDGKLIAVQGQETHGYVANTLPQVSAELRDFSVAEVLGLIEGGDKFHLVFRLSGAPVGTALIIPDGNGSLTEEQCMPGRRIADLPPF
jgi:hypothetical protein